METKTFLFFLVSNFVLLISAKYNVISNETIALKLGEIAFFESPDYPKFQTIESFLSSNLTFNLGETNAKNIKMLITLTYFYSRTMKAITENFILNEYSYSVRSLWGTNNPYIAVQGYLIFEEAKNHTCPMESISSKDNPFHFIDETYIIYLQSVYQNLSDSVSNSIKDENNYSCNWKFTAPEGYGFKIVLTVFEISEKTSFIVKNTTDVLINERSASLFHPYYNSDKYLNIYLSKHDPQFQLYISIVKNNPSVINGNCTLIENIYNNTKEIRWSSTNYWSQAYQNNIKCTYNFTIDPNTQVSFFGRATLEKYVDKFAYKTGNNITGSINTFSADNQHVLHILFTPENQYVYFEFVTDGSVQDGGFDAHFTVFNCTCDKNLFECGASTFISTNPSVALCSDLQCNFTLKGCDTSFTHISIHYADMYDGIYKNYIFLIYSNGKIIFDINDAIKYGSMYEVFVNSTNTNFIEVVIPKYPSVIYAEILSHPFEPPLIDKHIYMSNENNSQYDLDVGTTKAVVFEFSSFMRPIFLVYGTQISIEINGTWPMFFNDKTFSLNLFTNENCVMYETAITFKCEFKAPKFMVYPGINSAYSTYLAVRVSGNCRGVDTNGCVFEENIFIPKNDINFSIAGIATKNGICKLKVLISIGYIVTSLWTTASKRNVKIFAGNDEKFLLLEFNSKTMNQWTQIDLFSNFYIIQISNGDAVFLRLTQMPHFAIYSSIQNTTSNFRSIVSPPQYGAYKTFQSQIYLVYSINDNPVKITTLYSKMSENYQAYFQDENTGIKYFLNNTGDTMVFKNQIIEFLCIAESSLQRDTGAVYLIESIELPQM